jgi:hypothetical protein
MSDISYFPDLRWPLIQGICRDANWVQFRPIALRPLRNSEASIDVRFQCRCCRRPDRRHHFQGALGMQRSSAIVLMSPQIGGFASSAG